MSFKHPFSRQDLMMLRPSLVIFGLCLVVAGVAYGGVTYFNDTATRSAINARNLFDQATLSVQQIAQEEATIVLYIDRYRAMEEQGIVTDEDRLSLLERIGRIRSANDLFPINIEMGEQVSNPLEYDPNDLSPGDPVALRATRVDFRMSLLHEEDLTRLLDGLLDGNGLILPMRCDMRVNNFTVVNFTVVGEHLMSECSLQMFTYDLNPPVPEIEY